MIDINELRRLALDGDLAAMQEIILRLEAAEKSDAESLAMYRKARDERDALRIELNEIRYGVAVAHDTIKALRAKIEAMEQQEPAGEVVHNGESAGLYDILKQGALLYALPGAQSVPDVDALAQFIREVDGSHQLGAGVLAERIAEWLKAAPEAKP